MTKKRHHLATVFLLLLTFLLNGQSILDTLENFEHDSLKLNFLTEEINRIVYSNPPESMILAEAFDSIARTTDEIKYIVKGNVVLGMAHYVNQNFDSSLEYYVKALELEAHIEAGHEKGRLYNNLATVYQIRNNPESSIEYYEKALEQYQAINDTTWIANVGSNLGLMYLNKGRISDAEPLIREAVRFYRDNELTTYEGYALLNLGNLENQKKNYRAAIPNYERALQLVPNSVNPLLESACLGGLGMANLQLGNLTTAESFLTRSISGARQYGQLEQEKESANLLAQLYARRGRYDQAYHYHVQYTRLKDSLFTAEQDAKMVETLTKYESEKKEQQIALLDTEKALAEERLSTTRNRIIGLGTSLVLVTGFLFWLFRLNRNLKEAISDKNVLLKEIHHRVKNNLQVISALLTLQSNYVKDEVAVDALREGQDRVESMALIHKNLYQHDNLKGVNARDYIERLTDHLISSYQLQDQDVQLNLDIQDLMIDVDTMIPLGLIINELISNSLKHAFRDDKQGIISIALRESDGLLKLSVADNGQGTNMSERPTGGFGQSLIKSLARRLNAETVIQNSEGHSVTMNIREYKKSA